MFTKLATKVDSQEMWLCIVFGGDPKYFRPHVPRKPLLGENLQLNDAGPTLWNSLPFVSSRPITNTACRLATSGPKQKNAKLGQRGSRWGHVTYFQNFGIPSISRD